MKRFLYILLVLILLAVIPTGLFFVWGYHYITRDLPQLDRIEDYRPPLVSQVLARDQTVIGEFFTERRYPADIDEIPVILRQAFLAAEDAKFYTHPGIDLVSIFRAFVKNIQSRSARQGGSTITQQVVKNLLLSSQKKITRKLKEAILAYQLEERLSKDEILQIYLNQIFFGNGSYGIKAAVKLYYHKDLADVTLAESALLAGLPKAPSRYSPLANPKLAFSRQQYVLDRMVEAGFVTKEEADAARDEKIDFYRGNAQTIYNTPYYTTEVRRTFQQRFPGYDLDRDGYTVETAVDVNASTIARKALQKGIDLVDKRRGWRGPIDYLNEADRETFAKQYPKSKLPHEIGEKFPVLITQLSGSSVDVMLGTGEVARFSLKSASWANRRRTPEDRVRSEPLRRSLRIGDVIEVSLLSIPEDETNIQVQLDQTPELEGAVVLLDPATGEVYSLIGGYDFQRSQFNRVTQSYRQPGSSFKPIVYLAAIDGFGYTPASIVYDEQRTFKIGETQWSPGNFDHSFLGPITLRTALQKSRNLVSADIISRIGVESVIHYARKLGIESSLGANLSLSLGSSEVTLMEIARAYGVFANKGVLLPNVLITRILDREGNEIFRVEDEQIEKATRIISPEVAFVMANLMKGVVQAGTGWRVRELGRPAAGKTGTSNDLMDTWFVGYTPEWVCGVWVGFDVKRTIGDKETGGRVAAPIFLDVMKGFLDEQEERQYQQLVETTKGEAEELGIPYVAPERPKPADFIPPEGVVAAWVNKVTGQATIREDPNAVYDYFVKGTQPSETSSYEETTNYLEIPEL